MDNQRVIELPKSGLVRWLVLIGVFLFAACCIVVWMLPRALDDAEYLNRSIHLRKEGVVIQGTVSEVEGSVNEDAFIIGVPDEISYLLTVKYTVDDQTYTVRNQKYVNGYAVGDTIDVIYDPADPTISQVDFFSERWVDPILEMTP